MVCRFYAMQRLSKRTVIVRESRRAHGQCRKKLASLFGTGRVHRGAEATQAHSPLKWRKARRRLRIFPTAAAATGARPPILNFQSWIDSAGHVDTIWSCAVEFREGG